jgi:hypothetical protein
MKVTPRIRYMADRMIERAASGKKSETIFADEIHEDFWVEYFSDGSLSLQIGSSSPLVLQGGFGDIAALKAFLAKIPS